MRRFPAMVFVAVCFPLSGCYSAQEEALDRGVAYAKNALERVGSDPLAAASLESTLEMGGGIMSYLYAGMPDDPSFPRFTTGRPSQPWTVVVREGEGEREFVIEGYGEDLDSPRKVERVTLPENLPVPR
ncbi:MAG: hypothetical protein HY704_03375 [Gemmatimonadetes bacterium]|nr:hypothetical protein [Gemmatimonadota bacterium]